jgi:hypothetical protein
MLERLYFHGTSREDWAERIAKHGIRPPSETVVKPTKRGQMMPVVGRVYLTPHLADAQIYALGANYAGAALSPWQWKDDGRFGFLFVILGRALVDVEPDEDSVGEAFFHALQDDRGPGHAVHYSDDPLWNAVSRDPQFASALATFASRVLTPKQKHDVKYGHYPAWAAGGKRALKVMPDWMKMRLIEAGAHVSHAGVLMPSEMWRIDKMRSQDLRKDGSNFFEVAERIF